MEHIDLTQFEGYTPYPWQVGFSDGSGGGGIEWEGSRENYKRENGYYITHTHPMEPDEDCHPSDKDEVVVSGGSKEGIPIGVIGKPNANLIAKAPAILKYARELEDEVERLRDALTKHAEQCEMLTSADVNHVAFVHEMGKDARAALDKAKGMREQNTDGGDKNES